MKLGIIGLPFSGKTSVFEAITGAHAAAQDHRSTIHAATISVPDDRMDRLAERTQPKKITRAQIDFVDAAGVTADQDRDHIVTVLAAVREVDGLVHVARFFDSPSAPPHPRGSLDPLRDAQELRLELIVADLDVAERRIEKLEKQVTKPTPHQDQDRRELVLMRRIQEELERERPVSGLAFSEADAVLLRPYGFLSGKPMLHVLNVHEDDLRSEAARKAADALGPNTIIISARIEREISELDPAERGEFLESLGLKEPASRRLIRASYDALGLISFFTGCSEGEELRAWTVRRGDHALTAAGKIHSDIARGFIRAEVTPWEDVLHAGSTRQARAHGKIRLEGKDYLVQDGDVITFRFNV